MLTRFAIRRKSDGKFLSRRPAYGGRGWVAHVDQADMWRRRCDIGNVMNYIQDVKVWMSETNRRSLPRYVKESDGFPVEVVTFSVLLIDAKKGYLG